MKIKAFSLIELMTVVAIISILAAVAIPSYRIYGTRARINEAIQFASTLKPRIENFYNLNGKLPNPTTDNLGIGTVSSPIAVTNSNVVSYWAASNGSDYRIEIRLNANIFPTSIGVTEPLVQLFAVVDSGKLLWKCGTPPASTKTKSIPKRFLPSSCQDNTPD